MCSDDDGCLYGDPGEPGLEILSRAAHEMTVELRTPGFRAFPDPVGVSVSLPGFAFPTRQGAVDLPFKRAVLDAVVGRRARLVSVETLEELSFAALRPAVVARPEIDSRPDGTVRAVRRRVPLASLVPTPPPARLAGDAFMGQTKRLALELHPLRWDPARERLVLSRTLRVRIAFVGAVPRETGDGSLGRRDPRPRRTAAPVFAHFRTSRTGLHAVPYESVFPAPRRALPLSVLRLVQDERVVPVHVEPPTGLFGPGSVLYFHADREPSSTAHSPELSFALERATGGAEMAVASAAPLTGPLATAPRALTRYESNRIYQAGLVEARDIWLWEFAQGGTAKSVSLSLEGVDTASALPARVRLFLQGGSDSERAGEHHVSVSWNRVSLGETFFEGRVPHLFESTISAASLLRTPRSRTRPPLRPRLAPGTPRAPRLAPPADWPARHGPPGRLRPRGPRSLHGRRPAPPAPTREPGALDLRRLARGHRLRLRGRLALRRGHP